MQCLCIFTKKMKKVYYWVLLIPLTWSCQQKKEPSNRALYHWRTKLNLSHEDKGHLDRLKVKKLYVKFFDLDREEFEENVSLHAEIQADTTHLKGLIIVPCVFITNRSFQGMIPAQAENLVQTVAEKINSLKFCPVKEWQMDCDWSESTRDLYFIFLQKLRQLAAKEGVEISATIRLHQIKYPQKAGVPPVDRGMLMLYNVGDLENWDEQNSIFNLESAAAYAPFGRYKLPLDVVLAAYSWGVLFRDQEMTLLINDLRIEDLRGDERFEEIAPARFRVKKSTYLEGHYLYANDLIKIETCDADNLKTAARFAAKYLKNPQSRNFAIYHLHPTLFKTIPDDALENTFQILEKRRNP
jgi:hypothetical protein